MLTLVIFLVVLALLVLVHEFGHFVTARKAGMKVFEFGFGFPPRAFSKVGDTTYSFNWLPLGGFVKIKGEDGDSADEPDGLVIKGMETCDCFGGWRGNELCFGRHLAWCWFMIGLPTDVSEGIDKARFWLNNKGFGANG